MAYREILFRELARLPSTTYATHGLYMYPAKFIPHVVRYVIEKYTSPGDWVFDPFAGYGTVAVEASLTGRNAVLWDLNPMTEVFTLASIFKGYLSLKDFELDWDYESPFHPSWENIYYWHPREFYVVLSRLWGYWHREVYGKARSDLKVQRAYAIAIPLLRVTRFFSYSDEKIAKLYKSKRAVEKVSRLLSTDWRSMMVRMYWNEAKRVVEKIREYNALHPKQVEIVLKTSRKHKGGLIVFDSLTERLDRDVKLLITSPPYLQAQEYIRSFKLELAWLGYSGKDLRELSSHEIPYNKPGRVEVRSKTYSELLEKIKSFGEKLLKLYEAYFHSLIRFLNNNADRVEYIAIFVGPVKVRNLRVPIDEILKEHLETLGFKHVETLIDRIVARRLFKSTINPATGLMDERTPTEHLLVMKKKG
ncbi:MAG: DNA methyltransferase [Thermosphaera sp.]